MRDNKKIIISVVLVLVIILGGFGIFHLFRENRVASIVTLEGNLGIELKVNYDEDVVEVRALDTEAEAIINGMQLKGMDVDTAVKVIAEALLKQGYLNESAGSILVTVEDGDSFRGERLQAELTEEIQEVLYTNQTNKENTVSDVVSTGETKEFEYIGKEEAKKIAFTAANVETNNVRYVEAEMDYENGNAVYDVEFESVEFEYEYILDAKTGEILRSYKEYDDDYMQTTTDGK